MHKEKMKRLDSEQRLLEYEIEKLFGYMDLSGNEVILDVGAGTGAFTIPLAKRLENGFVKAVDINKQLLDIIDKKVKDNGIDNIQTIQFKGDLPVEEQSVDNIFICVVLHEIDDKKEFLKLYKKALKQDGKLFIVEFNSGKRKMSDSADRKGVFIEIKETESLLKDCGYNKISSEKINDLIYLTKCSK